MFPIADPLTQLAALISAKNSMQRSRGFTLTELVVVIMLIAILSATARALFSRPDAFNAYAARDLILAMAQTAQRLALANPTASSAVQFSISQSSSAWQLSVQQGGNLLFSDSLSRSSAGLSINGSTLVDGGSVMISFAGDGSTGGNYQWLLQASQSYPFCLTSTGFSHHGNCQP